jgi:hypothetical protein
MGKAGILYDLLFFQSGYFLRRVSGGFSLTLWLRRGRFPLLSLPEREHEKGIALPFQPVNPIIKVTCVHS